MVFTEILDNFIKILENIPGNLKSMSMTLLYFLSTIDIALTIYKNINNPDFNYINWAKTKILKVGFIVFAIKSYEWFLTMVKDFFISIGTKGLGLSLNSNNYFNDPSAIWDKGREIGGRVIDQLSWRPATYIFILLGLLTYIGFFLLAMRIIICWVEYYFLTGFSIVFLPFGALDLGVEYYKNVFKTIISCSIKLGVFNMWLLICDKLMKSIMVVEKKYDLDAALVVCGTVYILVAIMLSMPSITTSLLTGSPAVNAGAAMAGATGAIAGMTRGMGHAYRGTKETVKGAVKGAKIGSSVGNGFLGGLGTTGGIIGNTVGGFAGAIVGGSYAGARYGVFKEKAKDKQNNGNNNGNYVSATPPSNNSSSGGNSSGGNTSQAGSASNNGGSSGSTPNQQSTTSNSSGNGGGPSGNGQTPSSNIQGTIGSVNTSAQIQANAPSSTGDTSNTQSVASTNTTTIDSSNADSTQINGATQSSANDMSTDTNSVNNVNASNTGNDTTASSVSNTSTNTNSVSDNNTGNNIDNSNNTNSRVDASSENTTTTDIGDSSGKRGIKVNGGEAGKLPDWMEGDY
ncbi:conjugal transfer protein TrbL [Fusobacterium polymorphum]|uniref:Conjugal transfer protein TrbL n=2 Tax=Fusobacterium nucleatum subsp. polymorphum TaxID=76857 RepID=A0A241Q4X5_FUSNP|nr:conjugal transfer protein TrbL [Fusobacterium polymorphum]QYR62460.1 type IV secretion system protein [Fusobacterium polymorphum]